MARKNGNSGSNQKHGRAAPRSEALSLVIDPDAHRALDAHCGANPRNEVCGVLVGFTGEENGRRWTRIVAIIEGKHAREEQMSVTFTHETWDAVHEALSRRTDKARVVGWYHTHPDFGIFYSAPDVFVHRNFFNLEGQVGIVVDPVREERGVFASTAQGLVTLARYEVARQNARGHLVDCRYTDEPLRDDMPEARAAASTGDGAFTRSNLDSIEARLTEMDQRMGKLATMLMAVVPVVGLLALGAGLFLGRGLGSPHRFVLLDARGQQIGTIASVELVEATARAEEARLKEEAAKAKAKQRAEEKAEEKAAKEAAKDAGAEAAPAAAPAPAPAPAADGGAK
ncbi:MAG: Mov34/MPN/PAD-1 family protein [Planctomycetota bacterium]|nr:Mov34/MPN/PAD-1 family protein [Planctomycetota bacterium]